MKTTKYSIAILAACLFINNVFAETEKDQEPSILGTVWELDRNGSSSISYGTGQVVYFFSSDAYQPIRVEDFLTGIVSQWLIQET